MFCGVNVVLAERKLITYVYAVGKQPYSITWCKAASVAWQDCEIMGWELSRVLLKLRYVHVILKYYVLVLQEMKYVCVSNY
jgi:hypothetical protein